jgi:hypothetical protein
LGWHKGGHSIVLAGSSNYEDGLAEGASVSQFDFQGKAVDDRFPGSQCSTGPLALADTDGDGDLDLFVGGRVVPGRYPEPASSRLFRNDRGAFQLDLVNSQAFEKIGLVSGAVFSDLDGDGDPDLVLACEWGPIRLYRNLAGEFVPWDIPLVWLASSPAPLPSPLVPRPLTLAQLTGWWNGVATGDFDGDGRLDVVASNWGRNSQYESHRSQPLRLYYGDFNNAGQVDVVEAHLDTAMGKLVPQRAFESMANGLPFIREQYITHKAYGEASLAEILGDRLKSARELSANTLESMLFLNRGDHFQARPLPIEAQMAPAFGICVGDMDGDGNDDVFLSQNFFATQPLTSPYDAGRGLWLQGNGKGGFRSVPGQESGVKVYGEQRGCALADYDHDGRVDLVVAQNAAPTKLYHNIGAEPGLRIRLKGPPENPSGIGTVVRLICGTQAGPVREIHAGSGYWSQDGAVQVLAAPGALSAIWVRWPWANAITNAVPAGSREITISAKGTIQAPN